MAPLPVIGFVTPDECEGEAMLHGNRGKAAALIIPCGRPGAAGARTASALRHQSHPKTVRTHRLRESMLCEITRYCSAVALKFANFQLSARVGSEVTIAPTRPAPLGNGPL
jgi:hypothetical protein